MKENIETIILEFDNIATKIYFNLLKQFSEAVQKINSDKEENVF